MQRENSEFETHRCWAGPAGRGQRARAGRHAPDRPQAPRHLRPRPHHPRTGTARGRRPAGRLSGAARTGDAAGRAAPPDPHRRAPRRPSASCDAPPRRRGGPVGPSGETLGQEAQPRAGKTRSPPRPPPAHGARSRRRSHTPATPPHKAAHTATAGASGRNRARSPVMVADVGLNGARRRPSRH